MKVTEVYLVLYNLLSCAGWAYILSITLASYFQLNLKPSEFWNQIGTKPFTIGSVSFGGYGALHVIQSAAFLEVLHVAIGLVPSSIFSNVMQVLPRSPSLLTSRWHHCFTARRFTGWLPSYSSVGSHAPIASRPGAFLSVRKLPSSGKEKCVILCAGTSWSAAGRSSKCHATFTSP
jgi:hypothetical protein